MPNTTSAVRKPVRTRGLREFMRTVFYSHMRLVTPKPHEWQTRFLAHRARILRVLPHVDVQHIGSTAIPGIKAKDVVDVLVGVSGTDIPATTRQLTELHYVLEGERPGHAWLCWPAPGQREAVIHVMERGGEAWRRRLHFRDFLRQHPAEAKAYEALKRHLAAQTDDWGEYTRQKADFVQRILNEF